MNAASTEGTGACASSSCASSSSSSPSPFERLSKREADVVRALALGVRNGVIATALGFHVKTVDTHRRQAFAKLNVSSNVALARLALRHGFVSLDDDRWEPTT